MISFNLAADPYADQRSAFSSIREKWGRHHPKPTVVEAEVGDEVVAAGAARVPHTVVERAAPQHPVAFGHRVFPRLALPTFRGIGIVGIQTTGPFPDVAAQLLATIGAGATRETANRTGPVEAGLVVVGAVGVGFVSPGINPPVRPARPFLPFCFGG